MSNQDSMVGGKEFPSWQPSSLPGNCPSVMAFFAIPSQQVPVKESLGLPAIRSREAERTKKTVYYGTILSDGHC